MIGEQGENSCGKSGTDETPQERKRRGGSSATRGCTEINCGGTDNPYELMYTICPPLD
ncbi:hypothetical protein [Priestia megaterium]|uniref:hypothetical protein n=1 Tax=Priestia megaterium TaxID=1404 RepID=UPI003D050DC6